MVDIILCSYSKINWLIKEQEEALGGDVYVCGLDDDDGFTDVYFPPNSLSYNH